MIVEAQVTINAPRADIWAAMTDIENGAKILSGVEQIEILTRPAHGLVGLKWRETRILFGKPAAVDKWITDATPNESYKTRAEDDGYLFLSMTRIAEGANGTTLTSAHETLPQTFVARLKALPMPLFKGVIRKALLQDLNDIKSAAERRASI